jgi:RND family efflux transporter MFP subunit
MRRYRPPAATSLASLPAAAVVLILASACGSPPAQVPPPPKVTIVQTVEREVTEWDEYTARFDAVDSVEVRPRVDGYLQEIHFKDGALVKKGDLLFVIDPRPYEAAHRRAEAELQLAKSRLVLAQQNFSRVGALLPSHAISKEEADIREASLREAVASVMEAQAALDAAALDVEFTHITAPVSGRIGRKLVTEGNLITGGVGTAGTLLTTIVSLDPIYVYFDADERAFLKYSRLALSGQRRSSRDYGTPVRVALADEKNFVHEGVMDFVDNQIDRGTGTIIGRAILPNPDLTLTPGLFGRLRLPGSGEYHALLLPDEAVATDQSRKFVFVVDADGTAQYRGVTTGPLIDGLRVIRDGLTAQDSVIVSGMQRVRPGVKVDAQPASTPAQPTAASMAAAVPTATARETPGPTGA